ncbi:MAG: hypothetical protein ABW034_04835 [Steroidobacteraceae bacterium]
MHKNILASLIVLVCLPSLACAELDCIVPTREEGYESRRPGAEAVRRAARAIEAIVKRDGVFMGGNEPVRVRTSISYYGDRWLSASVITTAYNKKAWERGGCEVSQFADRGGGLADGQIAVYINDPDAMLGGMVGDSELPARLAPRRVGELAGFPLYGRGDDAADTMVMISSSNELPWTPVTIAEALDWREREIAQREANWQKQSATAGRAEAQLRAAYENMKKVDPAGAEKMRVRMERDLEKMRANEARAHSQSNDAVAQTRAEFDAYRASFSAAQLREPATLSGATFRKTVQRVDDPKGRPIVRVDTARAQRDPHRIRLLVIPQYSVATDEDHQWQVASRQALDYAALAALLEK